MLRLIIDYVFDVLTLYLPLTSFVVCLYSLQTILPGQARQNVGPDLDLNCLTL